MKTEKPTTQLLALLLCFMFSSPSFARDAGPRDPESHDVLTQKYDKERTGATVVETVLTPANVNTGQFGMLFTIPLDGQEYTQPLYVAGLRMADHALHNVVYVATMHNSLYAFDADDGKTLWSRNLGPSVPTADYSAAWGYDYTDIEKEVGILSTPVIDLESHTLYLVAATKVNSDYAHTLHAVDLVTGEEKPHSPVTVSGSVAGSGGGSVKGVVQYNAFNHLQRVSLALTGGNIIFTTAGHADMEPYHGWVFAYNAKTLKPSGLFAACQNADGCGIWESGQAASIDDEGNIYLTTGNSFGADPTKHDGTPNSILRFRLDAGGFHLEDAFTPANWSWLDANDLDLGVSGTLLIPGTDLILGGSKTGMLYNLFRDHLGGLSHLDVKAHQEFQATNGHIHAAPVYWNKTVYVWSENDYLKAYALQGNRLIEKPVMTSNFTDVMSSMPGGMLAISAHGNDPSSGILWANLVLSGDANLETRPGILRAFRATDLSQELWNSEMSGKDSFGNFAKFTVPTVANGKVYLATFSNQLAVYGLLNSQSAKPRLGSTHKPAQAMGWDAKLAGIRCSPRGNVDGSQSTDATVMVTAMAGGLYRLDVHMSLPVAFSESFTTQVSYSGDFLTFSDSNHTLVFRSRPRSSDDGSFFIFNSNGDSSEYGPLSCMVKLK